MVVTVKMVAWAGPGLVWRLGPFWLFSAPPWHNDGKTGQSPQWTVCSLLYFWKLYASLGMC